MSKQTDKVKPARRMRTTIVVEAENRADFEAALEQGIQCAREGFIGIKFRLKGKEDAHDPTIEVRTTRARRKP